LSGKRKLKRSLRNSEVKEWKKNSGRRGGKIMVTKKERQNDKGEKKVAYKRVQRKGKSPDYTYSHRPRKKRTGSPLQPIDSVGTTNSGNYERRKMKTRETEKAVRHFSQRYARTNPSAALHERPT